MHMEGKKNQKLSLKRKAPPLDFSVKRSKPDCETGSRETVSKEEPQISSDDAETVKTEGVIHLSSDSDVDSHSNDGKSDVVLETNNGSCEKEETDQALLEFRQTLTKLRKGVRKAERVLKSLPCHPNITKDRISELKEKIPKSYPSQYSPLPTACKFCRRVRPARVVFPVLGEKQENETQAISRKLEVKAAVTNPTCEDLPSCSEIMTAIKPQASTSNTCKQSASKEENMKKSMQASYSADVIPGSPIPNRKRSLFAKKSFSRSGIDNSKSNVSNRSSAVLSTAPVDSLKDVKFNSSKINFSSDKTKTENQISNKQDNRDAVVPLVSVDLQGADNSVRDCPMCGMKFKDSMTSMERDGHIASCLSAADDDVMW